MMQKMAWEVARVLASEETRRQRIQQTSGGNRYIHLYTMSQEGVDVEAVDVPVSLELGR